MEGEAEPFPSSHPRQCRSEAHVGPFDSGSWFFLPHPGTPPQRSLLPTEPSSPRALFWAWLFLSICYQVLSLSFRLEGPQRWPPEVPTWLGSVPGCRRVWLSLGFQEEL